MSSDATTHPNLDQLFSAPAPPPSSLSPQRLPGASLESLVALRDVLKDNNQRHDIFFNDRKFHNHITHRALAIYALGGSAEIIRDYYERDSRIQRPVIHSPEPITEDNFLDHLGDGSFYQAYFTFFANQVSERGSANTLEEFIFSEKYNFQEGRDTKAQPEMLARLLSGLLHPLIHVGYGVEFGLKGMAVEGLAMTAAHNAMVKGCFPPSFFSSALPDDVELTSRLSSFGLDVPTDANSPVLSKSGGVHAFDVVARILNDDRLVSRPAADFEHHYADVLAEYSQLVREHADRWTMDLSQPGEIERKMEELCWLGSLLYGVGGFRSDGFQADFFLMHTVTSGLFLPSLIACLSPRSQVLVLRGYLFTVLMWWVIRGRPALDIKSFMTTTTVEPSIREPRARGAPVTAETTPTPNPFLPVLQSAIVHPRDHVIKIQRAFAHFDTLYGRRPAGYFSGTELEGAELLDGTMFLRAALLTADYVGWTHEGQEAREFSIKGFFA